MAGNSSTEVTDWKRLWLLVSGIHNATPEDTVLEELLSVSKELQDGLLQFQLSSSSKVKIDTVLKEKKQEKLLTFATRLQEILDIESNQCWAILCNYFKNEYRGSASSLISLVSSDTNVTSLLDDICGYYTQERMILLKIIKNILIFHNDTQHPYQQPYHNVLEKITLSRLRESFMKQLENLINTDNTNKIKYVNQSVSRLTMWAERNMREINEVLHIILLIFHYQPPGLTEMKRLLYLFKQHFFGKQQCYLDLSLSLHTELLNRVTYSEVILLLACLDNHEKSSTDLPDETIVAILDQEIYNLFHSAEIGPILLAWIIFNIRCNNRPDNVLAELNKKLGDRALDLQCFHYLHNIVQSSMFQDNDLVSQIARETVYNLLSHVCDFFDGDGSCAKHAYIYELLTGLLVWPAQAKEFCKNAGSGVSSLYTTLLETFPLEFVHLSSIGTSLIKADMFDYVESEFRQLPIVTVACDPATYALQSVQDNEFLLMEEVRLYPCTDFVIPINTSVVKTTRKNDCLLHFRVAVNYFDVLHHEINSLLIECTQLCGEIDSSNRMERVNAGIECLVAVLGRMKSIEQISKEMVHPTEMCIDILNRLKHSLNPPMKLFAKCMNVCTALLPLADEEISTRVLNLDILPITGTTELKDYRKHVDGNYFDSRLLGTYLVAIEKITGNYDFLIAYLGFLRKYTRMQRKQYFKMEIPGLIFLLREVFPHLDVWRYQVHDEKNKIYLEIMGFIGDIFDIVANDISDINTSNDNDEKLLLRNICVYSLCQMDNAMMLLRFISLGNAYVQHTMEMETNWMQQKSPRIVLLVRMAMRILMHLLRLKSTVFTNSAQVSPLEDLIYTQPKQLDQFRIIPVVTSYMSNIFDRWLPILSCRLLKRIALEFNMSLLACLDMQPEQIRCTFLNKLPDELEDDSLKIAILELIEACISKQPGMTEAFFKVKYPEEKKALSRDKFNHSALGDSVITFLEDYLKAVEKYPHIVQQPLASKIMNLFHTLWKENMQILIEPLVCKPDFWNRFCCPLFSEFLPNCRAYTEFLNIMAIEMFFPKPNNSLNLNNVLERFLEPNQFARWLDFLLDLSTLEDNNIAIDTKSEPLLRLQAFKNFISILFKRQPKYVESSKKQLKLLAEKTIQILVQSTSTILENDNFMPLITLGELYLLLLTNFKEKYTESVTEDYELLNLIFKLTGNLVESYEDQHTRIRKIILAIIIKNISSLESSLFNDMTQALNFLESIVNIICIELQQYENAMLAQLLQQKKIDGKKQLLSYCTTSKVTVDAKSKLMPNRTALQPSHVSVMLSFSLLRAIADVYDKAGPANWQVYFVSTKMYLRLLSCAKSIFQMPTQQDLSEHLLELLIVLVRNSSCSKEFLHCNLGDYLWLSLLPPKSILEEQNMLQPIASPPKVSDDEWTLSKWWRIYMRGIELVTVLLRQHGRHILMDIIQFVGIHEEHLVNSLLLGTKSLEPSVLELVKCTIILLVELRPYQVEWRLDHSQSLFNIMRSVQVLLGHVISLFQQSHNLVHVVVGRRTLSLTKATDCYLNETVCTFKSLTEIIILCTQCLEQFSPDLKELIGAPDILNRHWNLLFEVQFGVPALYENRGPLTFGTLISIIGIFTKVLVLQNYSFVEDATKNNDNSAESVPLKKTCSNHQKLTDLSKTQQSSAAISTVCCPPNDVLINLDGLLCLTALEHILLLVATQTLLALKQSYTPMREKQLIRRELNTELLSFHEWVRKKIGTSDNRNIFHRRPHGQRMLLKSAGQGQTETEQQVCPRGNSSNNPSSSTSSTNTSSSSSSTCTSTSGSATTLRSSTDLRVNVVRRLHLQQHPHPRLPSNITIDEDPNQPPVPMECSNNIVNSEMPAENDTVDMFQFTMEDEKAMYSNLSDVQFVREDFMHFISNLFITICQ